MIDLEKLETKENLDDFTVEDYNEMIAHIIAQRDIMQADSEKIKEMENEVRTVKETNMLLLRRNSIKEEIQEEPEKILSEMF